MTPLATLAVPLLTAAVIVIAMAAWSVPVGLVAAWLMLSAGATFMLLGLALGGDILGLGLLGSTTAGAVLIVGGILVAAVIGAGLRIEAALEKARPPGDARAPRQE